MKKWIKSAYKKENSKSVPLINAAVSSINLTLDLLDGCPHSCLGCFVKRRNSTNENDLSKINYLINLWLENDFVINEVVLGPTDIFAAKNFDFIFENKNFTSLGEHFTFTCISTLMDDFNDIERRVDKINSNFTKCWSGREFETFVILDMNKFDKDQEYMNKLFRALTLFKIDDIFFTVNIDEDMSMFNNINLYDLNRRLSELFTPESPDCRIVLRLNPSFFRSKNKKQIEKLSNRFKEVYENEINSDEKKINVFSNIRNKFFGGPTFYDYAFVDHNLYVAPFLYENITQIHKDYFIPCDVNNKWQQSNFDEIDERLTKIQLEYSKNTEECNDCEHLFSCVSRNVLSYMKTRDITTCIQPKSLLTEPKTNVYNTSFT